MPSTSEQGPKEKGVLDTSFSESVFEVLNVTTWSHTISHIAVVENLDDNVNKNDCTINAGEPQALDYSAISPPTLELLEDEKYD